VGVIADFLGRRCDGDGRYFDIVVLGDEDIFTEFKANLRRCPAAVNVAELVRYWEAQDGGHRRQVLKSWTGRPYLGSPEAARAAPRGVVRLRDVNNASPEPQGGGFCAVATHLSSDPGQARPGKDRDDTLFERVKDERQCGADPFVWEGSRVVFMPYALAAKWVIYSGAGVPAHEAARHLLDPELAEHIRRDFERLGRPKLWKDLRAEHPHLKKAKLNELQLYDPHDEAAARRAKGRKYTKADLRLNRESVVLIVDECQNLATPSLWSDPSAAVQRRGVALSEALWRWSGDPATTPYLFAGTGTPAVGTNPESTICLLQIINGKGRATSFLPFLDKDHLKPVRDLCRSTGARCRSAARSTSS
jgi:hypothetical protein